MEILDRIFNSFKNPESPDERIKRILKKFKGGATIDSEEELKVLER